MRVKGKKLLVFLVMAMFFSFPSWAENGSNILFVLDASGSMKETIEGVSKLNIAKEVLAPLIEDLPVESKVGLMVYGHKGKQKGCKNIELIAPLKTDNQSAIKSELISIRASGKTPIAASLEKGAEALQSFPGRKMIILISDGQETCGGNPVKTARRIREKLGIDVAIHVIGFDVKGAGREQLAGIAKSGGGNYYSADNARQLKESLSKIKKEVKEQTIKKRKELKSGEDIFKDDFDGDFLSGQWEALNEDLDSIILDDGFLVMVNQPGSLGKSAKTNELSIKNVLLYKGELSKNYEVITAFTMEMVDWDPSKGPWSGLILYKDPKNIISMITLGEFDNYGAGTYYLRAELIKYQNGERILDTTKEIGQSRQKPQGKQNYYFKVRKEKFKYSFFFSTDGQKWAKLASVTMLGKGLIPGIAAWRSSRGQETMTEFDYFKIRGLE